MMKAWDIFKEREKHEKLLQRVQVDADNAEVAWNEALDKYEAYTDEEYHVNAAEIEAELDTLKRRRNDLKEATQALEENIDYLKKLEDNANWLEELGLI